MTENIIEKKSKKKPVIIFAIILLAIIAVLIAVLGINAVKTNKVKGLITKGEKYLSKLDYDRAIAAFEEAISIKPKQEDAYIGLADVYIKMAEDAVAEGNYAEARDDYEKAKKELERIPKKKKSRKSREKKEEIEKKEEEIINPKENDDIIVLDEPFPEHEPVSPPEPEKAKDDNRRTYETFIQEQNPGVDYDIGYYDLTHDGINNLVVLQRVNDFADGVLFKVYDVINGSVQEIYSLENYDQHFDMYISLYIVLRDNEYYLAEYIAGVWQGWGDQSYSVFYIDPSRDDGTYGSSHISILSESIDNNDKYDSDDPYKEDTETWERWKQMDNDFLKYCEDGILIVLEMDYQPFTIGQLLR